MANPPDQKLIVAELGDVLDPLPTEKPDDSKYLHNARIKTGRETHDVILKQLPRRQVISECVGWLVARRLELHTLDAWLVPVGDKFAFATAKSDIQTIKEAGISYQDNYWDAGVASDWFGQAFVFDTLVGNYDRVLRNMCFLECAPGGKFIFMDHDKILTHADWSPDLLHQNKTLPTHNNLVRFLDRTDQNTRKTILKIAQIWQKILRGENFHPLDQINDIGLAKDGEIAAIKAFLTSRAANLTPLVFTHLKKSPAAEK